jgi:hypothetical protein
MNKLIVISILILPFTTLFAQGNLQFNQVKNVEVIGSTSSNNYTTTIGSITVPSGKVWKIESVSSIENSSPMGFGSYQWNIVTLIGNHLATSSQSSTLLHFPIWISPGNYLVKCVGSSSPLNILTSISAIEFNIVP